MVFNFAAMNRHIGLPPVVLGHGAAPGAEKVLDLCQFLFVKPQFIPISTGHGLFGQIVFRGAQPAGKDQKVTALTRLADHALQAGRIVAHHGLIVHGNSQRCQFTA